MYHTWGRGARCSRRVITARACARGPLCSGEPGGAVAARPVYLRACRAAGRKLPSWAAAAGGV